MPGFDKEIAKLAQRVLINPRKIDYHTGVLATKVTPGAPRGAMKRTQKFLVLVRLREARLCPCCRLCSKPCAGAFPTYACTRRAGCAMPACLCRPVLSAKPCNCLELMLLLS